MYLLLALRMAVGAFQKAGVRVTDKVCDCLLVHTAVQKRGHIIVTQGVEMVLFRKVDGLIDSSQVFGKSVWMDELPTFIDEKVGAECIMTLLRFYLLAASIAQNHTV